MAMTLTADSAPVSSQRQILLVGFMRRLLIWARD
jgi:hypothetical protein